MFETSTTAHTVIRHLSFGRNSLVCLAASKILANSRLCVSAHRHLVILICRIMSLEHRSSSPSRALLALAPVDPNWRPIFHASNQVVLYNPTSHAISIQESRFSRHHKTSCPYCKQPLPGADLDSDLDGEIDPPFVSDSEFSRASNYFQLLAIANETSRPSTPLPHTDEPRSRKRSNAFSPEAMADGYFKAFFQEEYRLGMGAYGSVYLCQVFVLFHLIKSTGDINVFSFHPAYARREPSWLVN